MPPVLQGKLSAFSLPDVLTLLSNGKKNGTLTLTSDGRGAFLFFENGALVYAGSNQENFRLGVILLRRRQISLDERNRIDALMVREGGQFGNLAVREGLLTEPQLRDYLKVQVSEIVYDAFVWKDGDFEFAADTSLPSHAVKIAVDLPNLIMEGARRIAEWEQCIALLPDMSVAFRVVPRPRDDKITLTADEWKVLFLINGVRTLEDLCRESDEEAMHVYRIVYGLLANHLIEPASRLNDIENDTGGPLTRPMQVMTGDDTMKQGSPRFGSESTIQDAANDDTNLLMSSEARLSYAEVVRPTVAQLRMTNGEDSGLVIPLTDPEYLVGRHRDNSIRIPDLGISAFHARLYRGPEGFIVEDLKSRNGVWVNGARVLHATLMHGDQLHMGQTDLIYEVLL